MTLYKTQTRKERKKRGEKTNKKPKQSKTKQNKNLSPTLAWETERGGKQYKTKHVHSQAQTDNAVGI